VDRRTFLTAAGAAGALAACTRAGGAPPVPAPTPAAALRDGPWTLSPALQASIPALLAASGVPGCAVVVVERGAIAQRLAFGVRRAGAPDPMTPDTVIEAASLSKPVTAYAALRLVQAGRLALDRPLAEQAPLDDLTDARARTVTVRHVLRHAAGFPNWRFTDDALTTAFEPGTRFRYSGEGYHLLQRVVEQVTGQPFALAIEELVLAPFGMTRSSFVWLPAFEGHAASGHGDPATPREGLADVGRRLARVADQVGKPLREWTAADALRGAALANPQRKPVPVLVQPNAAGSLFTTATDYGAFLIHALAPGGPHALAPALRAEQLRAQTPITDALAWGLGWGLERVGDRTLAWHWGDNGGIKNFVVADAGAGRAIAVFTNAASGFKAYDRIVRAATGGERAGLLFWMVG
jgi:CubicO group peptidase (beta-lactamase class C family)